MQCCLFLPIGRHSAERYADCAGVGVIQGCSNQEIKGEPLTGQVLPWPVGALA